MVLAVQLILWIIFSSLYWFYFGLTAQWRGFKAVMYGFNVTAVTFLLLTFVWPQRFVYLAPHSIRYYALLVLLTAVVAAVLTGGSWLWNRLTADTADIANTADITDITDITDIADTADTASLETSAHPVRHLIGRLTLAILGAVFLGLAGVIFFGAHWISSYFNGATGDQFAFFLTQAHGEANLETQQYLINQWITPAIISVVFGLQIGFWAGRLWRRLLGVAVSFGLIAASCGYTWMVLPVDQFLRSNFTAAGQADFIKEKYVDPNQVIHFPKKKRNLIHIYMESVENSYYDKAHGGYDERNYMPDMMKLNQDALFFTQHKEKFGGPHQTTGSGHSIASMVNLESGVPLKNQLQLGNKPSVGFPRFTTLGDILKAHGYNTEFITNAFASWGNLGNWYEKHGDFKVFDHDYAVEHGYLPPGYKVWWGYEDDKLYEYAKQEILNLAKQDKPFYIVVENGDTHFPDGYLSPRAKEKPFDSHYGNVIFYSQGQVAKFVRWIQKQDFYKDTTIFINGDHRSMDKKFFAGWDPHYERTILNMYLNPVPEYAPDRPQVRARMFSRNYAPFDFFPTTMALLGIKIDGNRAGLGTNLLSAQKTLAEQMPLAELNRKLEEPSPFYSADTSDFKRHSTVNADPNTGKAGAAGEVIPGKKPKPKPKPKP